MQAPQIPLDWPNRAASRHVFCAPHLWHVQELGTGPTLLLIHGAGGASHSWRGLIPLLRDHYHLVALDLPRQGFTRLGARHRCGLDAMAQDLAALMKQEGWAPMAYIGHSAGAAIALRLAELAPPRAVIGINAALGQFQGVAGWLFPIMAKLLAAAPMVAQIFSRLAGNPTKVASLLASTGSKIDDLGQALYLRLLRMPTHVDATLAMMAQWTLDGLMARLGQQTAPCLLLTASQDRAVPAATSQAAAARMPNARWHDIAGYGHLVQEEAPETVAPLILDFLTTLPPAPAAGDMKASP
ncbi:MAG: alpha/beta fold hydrolase BchO [Paracoccaceae bacterium]